MKDARHRDAMAELYRIVERYENPPQMHYTDEAEDYFKGVIEDVRALYYKYEGDTLAQELAVAIYDIIGKLYKQANPQNLIDRERG